MLARRLFKKFRKMSTTRILVHLQNIDQNDKDPVLANFTHSVIDYFSTTGEHITEVNAFLHGNKLIISNDWKNGKPVKLKRPSFCPITNLTSDISENLPDDTIKRGIDSGVALILESADEKVLLTRRAKTLRTFPGVWVPPGGHLEENETFIQAGLRECFEETGLNLSPQNFVSEDIKVLALWESVYPPKLTLGPPKRHHVVVYLYGKLKPGLDSHAVNKQLQLDPSETDACAWFDKELVTCITQADEENALNSENKQKGQHENREFIRGHVFDNKQKEMDIPLEPLLRVSGTDTDHERVSTVVLKMAEGKPDLKHSQITKTLDKMFDSLTTATPLENKEQIRGLWMSLYTENLIQIAPSIANPLDGLCDIKKNMTKNLKARSLVKAWLYAVRKQYIKEFLFQERKNGLQVLIDYKPDELFDDEPIRKWLDELSLEMLDTSRCKSDTKNSLFVALHSALQRQIEMMERKALDKTLTSWESLKETLKTNISNAKSVKILREFEKTMEWKDMTKNDPAVYSNLPYFVMFAADAFSVKVGVLCYPSKEEVVFYPERPTERAIRIALINKHHYVCIIPKDEEKRHTEKVKDLELSIKDLKTRIQLKNHQINELSEENQKNKKEISKITAELRKLEEELAQKEKEKADLIAHAAEEMKITCQKLTEELTAKFVNEFASKVAGFTDK